MSAREFARILGVTRVTVIKWTKSGKIVAYSVHGRWRIPYSEVERLLGGAAKRRIAIYARVSSNAQKGDLERQVESLKLWAARDFPNAEYVIVIDVASGLKEDRRGLRRLIEMAKRREIDTVVVAYRDRLTRFGFEYLRELFRAYGVYVYDVYYGISRGAEGLRPRAGRGLRGARDVLRGQNIRQGVEEIRGRWSRA